jgi:hypothetical protein
MSHTIKVIAGGFALLAFCLIVARFLPGSSPASNMACAGLIFVALWFIGAGINMWVGVAKAGYSVAEEAPVFLVVFAIPAAVGILAWWSFSRR